MQKQRVQLVVLLVLALGLVAYLVVTLGFQKPPREAKAPSETKAAKKGAAAVEEGKAPEEVKGKAPVPGIEGPAVEAVQPGTKMGRSDYKPPEQVGVAADPFASFLKGGAAVQPPPGVAAPPPRPEEYVWVPTEGVPPPMAGQPPVLMTAPVASVTVKPVPPPKPPSFFERVHIWPGGVPGRPGIPRVTLPLVLQGTVVGDRPCAIVWDGKRSRIVGEGDSLTIEGRKVLFREIGKGYAQVVYDRRVRTLRLREET